MQAANIVGIVSLIFWSLTVIVSLKYVTLILRANNHGDDVITPAISVLSAVEGLEVAAPALQSYVVPVTLVALIGLFLMQKHGTAGIGAIFGARHVIIVRHAGGVWAAQHCGCAAHSRRAESFRRSCVLRASSLAGVRSAGRGRVSLTGAEALYANMGYFGSRPIRLTWFAVVFPALVLNYLGQGALLLADPSALQNPFYRLFPSWMLYPMVVLSTIAMVIASQAVISGTYSMTKQAMQLGFLPRMNVVYTSAKEIGQIYVPGINWTLLLAVVVAVLGFGSSTALGSAYGIAVTGTMLITTFLTFFVIRYAWRYNWLLCLCATLFFFLIDAMFFSANMLKIAEGGWFPLAMGLAMFTIMATWGRGSEMMAREAHMRAGTTPPSHSLRRSWQGNRCALKAPPSSCRPIQTACRIRC